MLDISKGLVHIDFSSFEKALSQVCTELSDANIPFYPCPVPWEPRKPRQPVIVYLNHHNKQWCTLLRYEDTWEVHVLHRTADSYSEEIIDRFRDVDVQTEIKPGGAWKFRISNMSGFKELINILKEMGELP